MTSYDHAQRELVVLIDELLLCELKTVLDICDHTCIAAFHALPCSDAGCLVAECHQLVQHTDKAWQKLTKPGGG